MLWLFFQKLPRSKLSRLHGWNQRLTNEYAMRHNDIPFYFRKHIKKYRWLIILMQRIRRKCDTGDSKFVHRPQISSPRYLWNEELTYFMEVINSRLLWERKRHRNCSEWLLLSRRALAVLRLSTNQPHHPPRSTGIKPMSKHASAATRRYAGLVCLIYNVRSCIASQMC